MSSRVSRSSPSGAESTRDPSPSSKCTAYSIPTRRGSQSRRRASSTSSMNSVPDSSPASGISSLYVATSWAMASSVSIRSARAISCTWNLMVSVFSNTIVTISPSCTRRRRLISMMRARKSSRSRSYARWSTMSSTVSFLISASLLCDPVRARHDLHRMRRRLVGCFLDRGVREQAVAHHELIVRLAHAVHEWLGDARCHLDVLGPEAPCAVDRRATLHHRDLRTGELHELLALGTDLLRAVVARRLPQDRAVGGSGEVDVDGVFPVPGEKVLRRVEGVLGDELRVVGAEEIGVFVLHHVGAGGLRHDDVVAGAHRRCEAADVLLRVLTELV